MNIERVKSIFSLFTGQKDYDLYLPVISSSILQVESMLKKDVDISDQRLDMLASAIANYRYVQIVLARIETLSVYNGEVLAPSKNSNILKSAETLMMQYMKDCKDFIEECSTVFIATGGDKCD